MLHNVLREIEDTIQSYFGNTVHVNHTIIAEKENILKKCNNIPGVVVGELGDNEDYCNCLTASGKMKTVLQFTQIGIPFSMARTIKVIMLLFV